MIRCISTSGDGSPTVFNKELAEHYHSMHGAVAESMHVYLQEGLDNVSLKNISVFEMGFGTGLNALLSLEKAMSGGLTIRYMSIEKYPLVANEWQMLDYSGFVSENVWKHFKTLHEGPWNSEYEVAPGFVLKKIKSDLLELNGDFAFDLVYFDAFSPQVQPELWTVGVFEKIYHWMSEEGILTTYSSKGSVRRALQDCGFVVERVKGPAGKREILRARKTGLPAFGK
jgi:tRNA U34 5-methylaminomethyl-2-thiouridine-forming methyltransferase MnmC